MSNCKYLKISSLNVNGLNDIVKKQWVKQLMNSLKVDIMFIQESNQKTDNLNFFELNDFRMFYSPGPHRGSGNIIGIGNNLLNIVQDMSL